MVMRPSIMVRQGIENGDHSASRSMLKAQEMAGRVPEGVDSLGASLRRWGPGGESGRQAFCETHLAGTGSQWGAFREEAEWRKGRLAACARCELARGWGAHPISLQGD